MSYLQFNKQERPHNRKTDVWAVDSGISGSNLGAISWFSRWRKYCFSPATNTIFDTACLREIADFCEQQTSEHKTGISSPVPFRTCAEAEMACGQTLRWVEKSKGVLHGYDQANNYLAIVENKSKG